MKQLKLKDIYDIETIINGIQHNFIFYYLSSNSSLSSDVKTLLSDREIITDYYLNRLEKTLSKTFRTLYENYKSLLLTSEHLAKIINNRFATNWNKLYASLFADYNPINNYDMIEEESGEANAKNTSETSAKQKYAGFNSSGEDLPIISESEGNGEEYQSKADNTTHRKLTRSGNIGVTTSQQMIESEIKLRRYDFITLIFNDIDKILFIDYYN